MKVTRRDFVKASSTVAGAIALSRAGLLRPSELLAAGTTKPSVVWLQAQTCSGCSVSLLNTINIAPIDTVLTQLLSVDYHPTIMSAAGALAVKAAETDRAKGGYVLVVEGAIPTGSNGAFCSFWPGMTAVDGVKAYAAGASMVIAVGTCASFGGWPGAKPAPTTAVGVSSVVTGKTIINIPGCPVHPDWLVGTIAYILANGKAPALDASKRPTAYFSATTHSNCPLRPSYPGVAGIGTTGCQGENGCKGPVTYCDCAVRKWNSGAANTNGVNTCVLSGVPCSGCTQPTYPDGMSPLLPPSGADTQAYCHVCHSSRTWGTFPANHGTSGMDD